MWHTAEIADIFTQISKEYGYDVFADRKKCVALCGDLFMRYNEEKNIFQMLFQSGLGETLDGVPFKSEQELRMGLLRIETFLKKQAIEEQARICVIEIIQEAFVDENVMPLQSKIKPIITKSFHDIHFTVIIPVVKEFADRVSFTTTFRPKKCEEEIDTIMEKCVITDRVNVVHESQMEYSLFPHDKGGKAEINVAKGNKKIFLSDAKVEFTYLCSNKKKVVISYKIDHSHILSLNQIEIYQMTDKEYDRTIEIIQLLLKKPLTNDISGVGGEKNGSTRDDEPCYASENIHDYSEALRKEILFLKQGKGKKYKVVNGVKINKDNKGIYTYSFEMETELHLPDDAPVVVDTTNGYHSVGTVLSCEDFQIMLLMDRDMGDRVLSAYLMVEPWKLLEALDKRINTLNPNINRLAIKLIEEGPKLSTNQDIADVPKGQTEVVNKMSDEDIVTVWGPPGTGKTYTMSKIAIDFMQQGKSVLIVSHSNVSVDGVVKKVVEMLDTDLLLKNGKILRFGYVRDEELSKHPYATSFNYALSKCPSFASELDILTRKRDELKNRKQTRTSEYDDVEKKIKKIREEIRKEERKYVEKAQLLGTTISRVTIDPMFEERQFDLVMFDEVSMAYVPQIVAAAALAKEKVLCVGDFRQLPPISQSPYAKLLQTDIFTYLKVIDSVGNMYWHPWLVMLNEQRRMHPAISAFPNKYIYKNLLKDHSSVLHCRDQIVKSSPLPGDALNLIDLAGTYCAADKNSDGSRFNIMSAIISFATAVATDKNDVGSIGIITPYAAQTRLIRAMIRDFYEHGTDNVSCATVHQFQGSESDVLIFDAVESYPKNAVGFLMGKDLNQVSRLINVAITRARGKLITVTNAKFWENVFKGTNHIFYKLLCHIQSGHTVINHKEKVLKPYIESLDPGKMLRIYTDEKLAISEFEKDMKKASGKVLISIPDGELRETEKQVLNIIEEAELKGVDILIKTNDYTTLPDGWKKYCWGTENATFPLIVIDDDMAWYGIPTSRMKFKVDKTTSNITVLDIMVRIKGKNTIEMMKALTELEFVQVGMNKRPLSVKKAGDVPAIASEQEMKSQGLAGFIEEKEFCPDCKSKMILSKNQKGTAYIRCSNKDCKHMEYLTPDLMNWYISTKNISCPKRDDGELKGILGKFGPCVRCSCGHFMKPEEI